SNVAQQFSDSKPQTDDVEAVNWNSEWRLADVWTIDPVAVRKLESATGFRYDSKADQWFNRNGESPTGVEQNLGFCAFYTGRVEYSDLLSADMRQGWHDAYGSECYASEMMREESDQRAYGWMS